MLLTNMPESETAGGITYRIQGELVPVVEIKLTERSIYFEHHVVLWKHPSVTIDIMKLKGTFKRMLSGLPILMTTAKGPGSIAFSRDSAGQVFAKHLPQGTGLHVREHQMLAATDNVDYGWDWIKGASNILFGGSGFFMDEFNATNGEGVVFLHAHGNAFEVTLEAGETIEVEPGGWLYKDPSVKMETFFQRIKTGWFSGSNLFWNRFTGPGKLGIQSMYFNPAADGDKKDSGKSNSGTTDGADVIGDVVGGVLDNLLK
jgi:uncharacterized protein (AIM24 family)